MSEQNSIKKAYLSFELNGEIFAITVHNVLEVLEKQKLTKVPKAPFYIKGVINFRGEILPVIDTRIKFNMPEKDDESKSVVIVFDIELSDKKLFIGGIVDGVKDVIEIADNEIKPVPDMGSKYNSDFIIGMIKNNDNFIMLLNIEKVFSTEEIVTISEQAGVKIELE
jgi:purine-binding chemotaxis protein CheW